MKLANLSNHSSFKKYYSKCGVYFALKTYESSLIVREQAVHLAVVVLGNQTVANWEKSRVNSDISPLVTHMSYCVTKTHEQTCFHCSCFAKEESGAQEGPVPCPGITPDAELTWCVAPRLIVGGKDAQVAAADELLIVHREQGARGGEELRVKNHLAVEDKGSARAPYLATPWGSQRG